MTIYKPTRPKINVFGSMQQLFKVLNSLMEIIILYTYLPYIYNNISRNHIYIIKVMKNLHLL